MPEPARARCRAWSPANGQVRCTREAGHDGDHIAPGHVWRKRTTERGFAIYAEIKDGYGAEVRVVESSAATVEGENRGPWVWVFIEGGATESNDGAAHLDPGQARAVRDALSQWLDEVREQPEGPQETAAQAIYESVGGLDNFRGAEQFLPTSRVPEPTPEPAAEIEAARTKIEELATTLRSSGYGRWAEQAFDVRDALDALTPVREQPADDRAAKAYWVPWLRIREVLQRHIGDEALKNTGLVTDLRALWEQSKDDERLGGISADGITAIEKKLDELGIPRESYAAQAGGDVVWTFWGRLWEALDKLAPSRE